MRQAGILAAAGRYALAHNIDAAGRRPRARADPPGIDVAPGSPPGDVQTNIVVLDLSAHRWTPRAWPRLPREQGVLVSALGPRSARLVTHLDVDTDGAKHAADVLAGLLAG